MERSSKKIITTPVILAIPIGIILHYLTLPSFLTLILDLTAQANTFVIMFAVGVMLSPSKITKKFLKPTAIIAISTLIIAPLIVFYLGQLIGLSQLPLQVATLEQAMPMAVVCLILIKEYQLNVDLAETVLFVTTILSIITLPLLKIILF